MMTRFARLMRRRLAQTKLDPRGLIPISLILIAGLLAFSAEISERVAPRSTPVTPSTLVSRGH